MDNHENKNLETAEKEENLFENCNNSLEPEPTLAPEEDPTIYDFDLLQAALDGLLLVQSQPLPIAKIAEILTIPVEIAEKTVNDRKKAYEEDEKSGLQVAIVEKGVQLATKAKISSFIQRMDGQKLVSLSLPALESLSVIAFKQPITKAEIDAIRGVDCGGVVSTLLEKKLIYVSGEKPVIGRPRLYSTTQDFLYYFGMKSLKELPIPEIEIPEELTPEGQKAEKLREKKDSEKEFNKSQGLLALDEAATEDSQESQELQETQENVISEEPENEPAKIENSEERGEDA